MSRDEYLKMQSLGDWLVVFLEDKNLGNNLRLLAADAVQIWNIDYTVKDDDPIMIVEFIERNKDRLYPEESVFGNVSKLCEELPTDGNESIAGEEVSDWRKLYEKVLSDCPERVILLADYVFDVEFDATKLSRICDALRYLRYVDELRETVRCSLKEVYESNQDWQVLLAQTLTRKASNTSFTADIVDESRKRNALNGYVSVECENVGITIDDLNYYYGCLVDSFFFKFGKIEKGTMFSQNTKYAKPSYFPWEVVLSRVFFDYLHGGGQGYFGYCPRCGNFFVERRKGIKKYCSKTCTTMACIERKASAS